MHMHRGHKLLLTLLHSSGMERACARVVDAIERTVTQACAPKPCAFSLLVGSTPIDIVAWVGTYPFLLLAVSLG